MLVIDMSGGLQIEPAVTDTLCVELDIVSPVRCVSPVQGHGHAGLFAQTVGEVVT